MRVGAGVTYTRIIAELGDRLPGLAIASRTVGSLQIRNRGTVGGNLATASPAGDGAAAALHGGRGRRARLGPRHAPRPGRASFITGPEAQRRWRADELIAAFDAARGGRPAAVRQGRDAQRDGDRRLLRQRSRCGRRSAAWRPASARPGRRRSRAAEAEAFIAGVLDWDGGRRRRSDAALARFGELAGQAARPIDDVRGTADYRRHAVGVLARRTLAWAWGRMPRDES